MNDVVAAGTAEPPFLRFAQPHVLYSTLADAIAARLKNGVARNGRASLVLSGGTTPGALYDELATREVPWNNVAVTISDERWTDPRSERSNEHLARTRFLTGRAAAAQFIPLKSAHSRARDAEASIDAAITAMARPFDVVLLGMGTDGHIASLIPGSGPSLARALDASEPPLVRAIDPPDLANMGERMTLTLRAILQSRWIVLLIRGEAKLKTYKEALADPDAMAMPVRAVLHQRTVPVSIYWAE